jgi:hypothetical protein
MAYYIGEQIALAGHAKGADKAAAERKCFETILALWKHRSFLPDGHRPFESFEPIFRALARLDPQTTRVFYHYLDWHDLRKEKAESNVVEKLIDFIFQIDGIARTLIQEALNQATTAAASKKTKQLLKKALADSNDGDIRVVVGLSKASERTPSKKDRREAVKDDLEKKIVQLDAFCLTAGKVREILKTTLQKLAAPDE